MQALQATEVGVHLVSLCSPDVIAKIDPFSQLHADNRNAVQEETRYEPPPSIKYCRLTFVLD